MSNNHIDKLDETLRILFLESVKDEDVDAQKEMSMILAKKDPFEMSQSMQLKLIRQLENVLTQVSLGQLIKSEMQKNNFQENILGDRVGLPLPVLEELKEDAVFTNDVPIVLLKKLLTTLNISFQSAEQAIRKTFDLLQSRIAFGSTLNGLTPAFKKGGFSSGNSYLRNISKNSGKELFQNEEALNRYLNRLDELMKD